MKLGKRGLDGRKWKAWPNSPEKHPNPVETPEGRHDNTALRCAPDGMGRLWASVLAVLGEVPLGGEARGRGPASSSTSGT